MITLDGGKCTRCGLCVRICHEGCLTLGELGPAIDRRLCSTCTQCVAVCPQAALSWDGVPPARFEPGRLPDAAQLDELFRERRSLRSFSPEPIPRALLAEIAASAAYAPTHNFTLRLIVVDEAGLIRELDQSVLRINRRIYRLAYGNPLVGKLAGLFGYAGEYGRAQPKIEAALRRGQAWSSLPAAVVMVAGDRKVPLSEASAQYALANMMYYAQVRGLGSCLWGNAPIFVDRDRRARRLLGIGREERIYAALCLGWPALRFTHKVTGKTLPLQWNGGEGAVPAPTVVDRTTTAPPTRFD